MFTANPYGIEDGKGSKDIIRNRYSQFSPPLCTASSAGVALPSGRKFTNVAFEKSNHQFRVSGQPGTE